jgi:hypothetical protein
MTDEQLKDHAVLMWAAWIETGDPNMTALDAIRSNQSHKVNILTSGQISFVQRLRKLTEH